jgi:cytochrome c556
LRVRTLRTNVGRAVAGCFMAVLLASATVVLAQDDKITTPEALDKVMKKTQPMMRATQKAISSGAYADARTQVATLRQAILDSQQFWVEKKRDDAIKMNQETIDKIDVLDKALSAEKVETAAAMAALKEVGGTCRTCHTKYRAQDAENNYIIKPGSLEAQ